MCVGVLFVCFVWVCVFIDLEARLAVVSPFDMPSSQSNLFFPFWYLPVLNVRGLFPFPFKKSRRPPKGGGLFCMDHPDILRAFVIFKRLPHKALGVLGVRRERR